MPTPLSDSLSGLISPSDFQSVADPLAGLLSDPLQPREFLLRALPESAGVPVNVDISSSGYVSRSTDSVYKFFPEGISKPYNFSAQLPLPNLMGGSSLGIGELSINNPDSLRDADALHDWLGVSADVYIGEKYDPLTNFTRFFRGKSAGVSWNLNTISVLHRDLRFKLQKRLQQNRYMGTDACLRFDGSGDYVSYGDILDQTSSSSFTAEILFRTSVLTTTRVFAGKKLDLNFPGSAGWRLTTNASNQAVFVISDGTNTGALIPSIASYFDGKLHRITAVCDRTAQVLRLYVDGVLLGTSGTISAVGNLSNGDNLAVGAISGAFSWNGDLDDFRFWTYARTQAEIQADMHREIPAQTNLALYSKFNEGSGTSASDSSGNSRTGTITGATWVGSLEGDASIAGTPKPVSIGLRRQITPKLVDSQRLVYQWHDGSGEGLDVVRDSGDELTFGSAVSDIYSSTPAAGSYNTCNSKGLFRLGSSPVGAVTCDVRGDNSSPLGYTNTPSTCHRKLATKYGGLIDPDDIDIAAYAVLGAAWTDTVGEYYDTDINVDVAMDNMISPGWWSSSRTAQVVVGRVENPSALTPSVEIDSDLMRDPNFGGAFDRKPVGVRIGTVIVGYRPYHTVLSDDQVGAVVPLSERNDFGQEYRYVSATDPDRSSDSDTLTVLTNIDDKDRAQAEANRLLAIWKVDRSIYHLSLDEGILSYFIGTVMRVTYARYDLVAGKVGIVIGVIEDMGQYGTPDSLEVFLFM